MEQKKIIEASYIYNIHTGEKNFLQLLLLKVCEPLRLGQIKKTSRVFGLYESSFTFIEMRRPIGYCLRGAHLISYM